MTGAGDQRPTWIYPLLFAGVLSFAVSAILVRYASEAAGLSVAAIRTTLAIIVLAPLGIPATVRAWRTMSLRDAGLIVLAGVLLGVHFVSWISSIYHTSVASAAVLVSTGPIFMALFGYLILGEHVSRRLVASIGLAVGGSALLAFGGGWENAPLGGNPLLGNGLALFAAVMWALYLLIGRVVRRRLDWLPYVFPLYVVAGITTLAFAVGTGSPLVGFSPKIYLLCLGMALLPQILGHGSFNFAVKFFPAAMLGLLGLLEPIGASLLALMLFGEMPGTVAVLGMLLILVAVGATVGTQDVEAPVTD